MNQKAVGNVGLVLKKDSRLEFKAWSCSCTSVSNELKQHIESWMYAGQGAKDQEMSLCYTPPSKDSREKKKFFFSFPLREETA